MTFRAMPVAAFLFLLAVGTLLAAFALGLPLWGWLAAVTALLVPGRWWRWRTRRFRRGTRALERGRPEEARRELEAFLEEIRGDERFHRAQPLFNLGRRHSYRSAALSNLGLVCLREGRPGRALERFGEALAEEPGRAQAHYGRALALRAVGRGREAEEAVLEALEARPGYTAAQALLALLRRERGDGEAAGPPMEAIGEAGHDPEAYLERLRRLWPPPGESRPSA